MYCARIRLNRRSLDLLDAIVSQTDDRNTLAVQLVNDCGYDVWEAICEEFTRVQYSDIEVPGLDTVPVAGLTRQYWAREVLCVISRCLAVKIWLPLNDGIEDVSFERGLAALSAFFGEDIEEVMRHFSSFINYLTSLIDIRSV